MSPLPPPRPRTVYSGVLLNPCDAVLVVHHKDAPGGVYDLPGVTPDADDNGWIGLAAAIKTATGLEVTVGRLLATELTPADPQTGTPAYRHRVRYCGLVPQHRRIILGDGLDHYRWLAADAVAEHCGSAARRIQHALKVQRSGGKVDPRNISSVTSGAEV
ncbi:NUDIX hydrolase [Streptomyces rimosus]|uniref:NUDIX hydrolase n=1 Tax=Streptomyces rimosus TaxID=1927 RepID=UPI0004BEF4E1|nr:NUDIX hydrolase [Streptomyces rimosus]